MAPSVIIYLATICRHKLHVVIDALIIAMTLNLLRTFIESNPQFASLPELFIAQVDQNTYRYEVIQQRLHLNRDLSHDVGMMRGSNEFANLKELQDRQQLDVHTAYKIISSNVLYGDTFRIKQNLEKLLTVAEYINNGYQKILSPFKSFDDGLNVDSFYGQKFLVESGMRPEDLLSRAVMMERHIKFTRKERNQLERVKMAIFHPNTSRNRLHPTIFNGKNLPSWQHFHDGITSSELYREDDLVVNQLLNDLQSKRITNVTLYEKGSQLKFIITLADGGTALFKPKRLPPFQSRIPNSAFLNDLDRHTSEIAAFHLDRAIGFHRATPSVGRILNITKDIIPFMSERDKELIYKSPAGHLCMVGRCRRYCTTKDATCGTKDLLQGSLSYFLKSTVDRPVKLYQYSGWPYQPWRKIADSAFGQMGALMKAVYNVDKRAKVLRSGRVVLDVTDAAIFDFLIDNSDRHYLEYLHHNNNSPLLLDNGKGFGRAFIDTTWILAPITECRTIRFSTLNRLLDFERGSPKLSDTMRESLSHDLLAPVLLEEHLLALDRRVRIILKAVYKCIMKNGSPNKVVVDDGY